MTQIDAAKATVTGVAPMFLVDDVVATAEWYRDKLGFEIGEYYSDDHRHDEEGNDIPGSPGEVFFVIIGELLFLDDDGNIIARENRKTSIERYEN